MVVDQWWCRDHFQLQGQGVCILLRDQHAYLSILKTYLLRSVDKLTFRSDWQFYQDNDPKHKAYKVRSWLLYNCLHVIETPPQSPDINPFENLWNYLDAKVREHKISCKTELKSAKLEEWEKIPPRLKMIVKNNGLHTKH